MARMPNRKKLTVFFDGTCPLCQHEVSFYRCQRGADGVAWVDVALADSGDVVPGLSRDKAMSRFHVMETDGQLISGGAAFSRLWRALPAFRFLGRLFQVWPLSWLSDRGYDAFLKIRPWLQSIVARRTRNALR